MRDNMRVIIWIPMQNGLTNIFEKPQSGDMHKYLSKVDCIFFPKLADQSIHGLC